MSLVPRGKCIAKSTDNLPGWQLAEDAFELASERRDIVSDNRPDLRQTDTKVPVNNDIAESGDAAPGYVLVLMLQRFRNALRRLGKVCRLRSTAS